MGAKDHRNKRLVNNLIYGSVAQSVEQRTENPCVGGSIPSRAIKKKSLQRQTLFFWKKTKAVVKQL
jgi:hypothetical protein